MWWMWIGAVQADPALPERLLVDLDGAPDHSAFVLLGPDELPRLIAPADALAPSQRATVTWAGETRAAAKLKGGGPDATAATCAPGGEALGSRRLPTRLADHALTLAPQDPAPLEHVWIVSRSEDGRRVHPATVESVDAGALVYVLQQPVPLVREAGAPVVDVLGRVVGVHLGVEVTADGRSLGRACPLAAVFPLVGRP